MHYYGRSMPRKRTVCLCIIVRNERRSSEVIFPKIPLDSVDRCIVIDGHSTDGTQEYYDDQKILVFEQKIPGLGGATFAARQQCRCDAMILFHPDGNENPQDIAKVADLLRKGHELVIPSRMIAGGRNEEDGSFFKPRKWFNLTLAWLVNFIWNDYSPFTTEIVQGFRGIQCETFDRLGLTRTDLTMDFHMVIKALKHKVKITEFPTIEGDRLFGETNFGSLSTGTKELAMLWDEITSADA